MKLNKWIAAASGCAVLISAMGITVLAEEAGFSGGTGVQNDPYIIAGIDDLNTLANNVNNGTDYLKTYFKISDEVTSIDLGALDIDEGNSEDTFSRMAENVGWTPIGSYNNPFRGVFDGNSKAITNLSVVSDLDAGLFGYCKDGEIKNLKLCNVSVKGNNRVGAIAGCAYTSDITNCSVTGTVNIEGKYMVGGITGYTYGDVVDCGIKADNGSYVKATYLEADLEGDNVGGIVGYKGEGRSVISGCDVSNIAVSGVRKVGGILGMMMYGNTVKDCTVNNVSVSYDGENVPASYNKVFSVGGAIGEIYPKDGSVNTIENIELNTVSAAGRETDTAACGLYIGSARNRSDLADISDLVSVSNVSATNSEAVNADKTYDKLFEKVLPTVLTDAGASAVVREDGKGVIRFITKVEALNGTPVKFGTYMLPFSIFEKEQLGSCVTVEYIQAIEEGNTFSADLTDIPDTELDTEIYARSFMFLKGIENPVIAELNVESVNSVKAR